MTGPGAAEAAALPAPGTVHVHWFRLAPPPVGLAGLLSPGEQRRAAAHHRPADRLRSAAGAALLRVVAGRYLGLAPGAVPVTRSCDRCGGEHGRPRIDALPRLHLSVAHSGTCAVLAVALGTAVGIDVEALDVALEADEILRVAAAPGEAAAGAAPESERRRRALVLWTRKEAVLKAAGTGLAGRPASIATGGADAAPRVTSWPLEPHLAPLLRLRTLQPPAGHVATVAVVGGLERVVARDVTGLVRTAAARGSGASPASATGREGERRWSSPGGPWSSPVRPAGSVVR